MGNSSTRDSDLTIYIETEKPYYNSGSFIEGVVFVEAKKHFAFDALYIRVEGKTIVMQAMSGRNGSRAAPKIGKNTPALRTFLQSSIFWKATRRPTCSLENMPILFRWSSQRIFRGHSSLTPTTPESSTSWQLIS